MRKGFTLIELLVVISIVALLSSVILAAINSSRDKAKRTSATESLSSLRSEMALYMNLHNTFAGGCAEASQPGKIIASAQSVSGGTVNCYDAPGGTWAAEIAFANSTYFCVDSTGFAGASTGEQHALGAAVGADYCRPTEAEDPNAEHVFAYGKCASYTISWSYGPLTTYNSSGGAVTNLASTLNPDAQAASYCNSACPSGYYADISSNPDNVSGRNTLRCRGSHNPPYMMCGYASSPTSGYSTLGGSAPTHSRGGYMLNLASEAYISNTGAVAAIEANCNSVCGGDWAQTAYAEGPWSRIAWYCTAN